MIITLTGRPCSGKGTVAQVFCKNHKFEYLCTGDINREYAKKMGYDDFLAFQTSKQIENVDNIIDSRIKSIGESRLEDNLLIDSRLAWHFIPNSFKVFINVSWESAGERLFKANRPHEKARSKHEATRMLKNRWKSENDRYMKLYNVNNIDLDQFDLVISSSNKTPEQIAEIIYKNYIKFAKKS